MVTLKIFVKKRYEKISTYSERRSQPQENMDIIVLLTRHCDTMKISLRVEPSDTLESIKAKVQSKAGIPSNQQMMVFAGVKIVDIEGSYLYDLVTGSTLHFVIIHDESNIQVLIKIFSCNKTISLEVKPSDTIQKIKSIIREEEEIPEHQQLDLILAGEKLDDDKTISACQILNGTTLNLIRWFAIDHFELK